MPKKKFSVDLIKPSTKEFFREARITKGFTFFDLLHGYIYARFPYFYIGVATGTHPLAKKLAPFADRVIHLFANHSSNQSGEDKKPKGTGWTIADTYHGKVMPLSSAKELIQVKENIRLENLEQVLPYPRAKDLILQHPDHIAVLDCPCRAGRDNPCLPLDVCLIVGEPFASFIIDHHPDKARWITQTEAVSILEQEHQRGHVHHAFFKDAMLLRYFAICNCCSCCCGAMQAHQNGIPMLESSGFSALVDASLCGGCGHCMEVCPFSAITVNGHSTINIQACMGCGVCVSGCPQGAITLERNLDKSEPLAILEMINKVNPAG